MNILILNVFVREKLFKTSKSFMQESGHSFDFIAKVCIILSVLLLVHPLVLGLQLCKQRASNQVKPDVNELNSVQ